MLKVFKYENHGICMRGGDEEEHHQKFLFSFFELNNKKIISLMIVENWFKDKLISDEYNVAYTNYNFDQNWDKWWKSTFDKNLILTDYETQKFIENLHKKNHHTNRYKKTNVL